MENNIICPACQRNNRSTASHCIYCGTPLEKVEAGHPPTTKGVHITPAGHDLNSSLCAELAQQLPEGAIALLVAGGEKPVILEDVATIVLGRGSDSPPGVPFLDLSILGDLALGISRQHARISFNDGQFWLEDMHSTNGCWLNRKRVVAGVPYPLSTNDSLWLGPMKMTVCLGTGRERVAAAPAPPQENTLCLQPRNKLLFADQLLSPAFLQQQVAPYLEALADVQQATDVCRGKTAAPSHILAIKADQPNVIVTLTAVSDVVSLFHAFIATWRDHNFAAIQSGALSADQQEALLLELAQSIYQYIMPMANAETRHDCLQVTMPGLRILATSQLEITNP